MKFYSTRRARPVATVGLAALLAMLGIGLSNAGQMALPTFDTFSVHTGRGFGPAQNPAVPDSNDGNLHGATVLLHTGSFSFNTGKTRAIELGLNQGITVAQNTTTVDCAGGGG